MSGPGMKLITPQVTMTLRQAKQETLINSLPSLFVVAVLAPGAWWLTTELSLPGWAFYTLPIVYLITIPVGVTAGGFGLFSAFRGHFPWITRVLLIAVHCGSILFALYLAIGLIKVAMFWKG